ncbi:transposase, partial [Staphylococcus arlettae CVD059]
MSRKLIDLDLLQSVFNNYENGMSFESIVEIVDVNLSQNISVICTI